MAYDYGLVGGIGQGLQQGLLTYMKAKQLNRENQIQNLTAGIETDENGNLKLNDQMQAIRQAQAEKAQHESAGYNPNSQYSQDTQSLGQGILNASMPNSGVTIPKSMSASDINSENGIIGKAISGGYGMQGNQLKYGTMQDIANTKNDLAMKMFKERQDVQDQRMNLMKDRFDYQQGKEARSSANNDSMMKQYIPRLEGASKIGELIDSAFSGKVVSNQALLGQVNAEIARLETGSQSPGLGQSEKTELNDRAAQLKAWVDSFTGKPGDAVRPEVLQSGKKLVNELTDSYQKGIDARMDFLKSGLNDEQAAIIDNKYDSIKRKYGPRLGHWLDQDYSGKGLIQGQPGPPPQSSGLLNKVKVSNGKKTYLIDSADVEGAAKDGFQVVK